MEYDPKKHRRRSVRLRGYDYSTPGAYFVTACTHNRQLILGEVAEAEVVLSQYGTMEEEDWLATAQLRTNVELDAYVVMPNHFHAVMWISGEGAERDDRERSSAGSGGTAHRAPTAGASRGAQAASHFGEPVSGSLSTVLGAFTAAVTRRVNQVRGTPGSPFWQRGFHEHVIRTDKALGAIGDYIWDNPLTWSLDRYNPEARGLDPQTRELWRMLQATPGLNGGPSPALSTQMEKSPKAGRSVK